jgi:sugar phosphate isomerase/epimerase
LASLGLSARAISAHIDLGRPDASAMLARRLRFAASIGAQIVITNASPRADLPGLMQCLDKVLPEAEAAGVTVALENPGHGRDALISDGAAGAALVAQIGSKRLRLNYDCANVLSYSEGRLRPEDDIDAALPALAHIHFKDVRRTTAGWAYAPLGEGEVALDLLAGKLCGLSIPVGLELPLRLSRRRGGDPERLRPPLDLPTIRAALRSSLDRARQWMGLSAATEG